MRPLQTNVKACRTRIHVVCQRCRQAFDERGPLVAEIVTEGCLNFIPSFGGFAAESQVKGGEVMTEVVLMVCDGSAIGNPGPGGFATILRVGT
jgi:hypothetical protein